MYQVILPKQVEKDLKKLDKVYLAKVSKCLDLLGSNPFLGEKMAGVFQGSYRIKIPLLRIICTPDLKSKIIWIRAIGFRGGIYRK